jgi:apoptosis-inducing factor 2
MKKLIIIGGGFAGIKIAKSLEKRFEIKLIDNKDYFEFTPSILRAIISPKKIEKIQLPHKKYLKNTKILTNSVKEISENWVKISSEKKLFFDYLVIATGSKYNFPFKEKNLILTTRGNNLAKHHEELKKSKSVSIIGGGLVGIELAGEIKEFDKNKKIILIHSQEKLISRNHSKSILKAQKFLEKNNVKIILNEKAEKIKKNKITTSKNTKIKSDLIFLCTGISPNSEFMKKNFKAHLTKKGNIKVNKYLQLKENEKIFVAGDVTDIKEEKTAQNAEKHADIVIKNLINLENKSSLIPYTSKKSPFVISLGKYNGILEYKNFVISGIIPAFLKFLIEKKTMARYKK